MKKALTTAILVACLVPVGARAQERAGDAALGALSGAFVFGPVGAVAGALVGYTAGPDISRSWRLRSPHHRPRPQSVNRSRAPKIAPAEAAHSAGTTRPASGDAPAKPAGATGKTAGSTGSATGMPPVQTLE
jgi:hypothetical protein